MSNITKRKAVLVVVICLLISLTLSGCGNGREYHDDIRIKLKNRQAGIIIKEWTFLLGSGAEIYYKDDDKEILLGQISGGDDGHCPFKEGLYSVKVDDNKLTIEVGRRMGAPGIIWGEEVFELPE